MSASRVSATLSSVRAILRRIFNEPLGLAWGVLTNAVTTTLAFWVSPHTQLAQLMIIHLLGAVLISTRYGMVVSTFTAVTGALAFDYFCIPPVFAFALPDPHSVLLFAGIMVLALLVCWASQSLREQRAAARASEQRTQALCELSLDLSQVVSRRELSARADVHLQRLFGAEARLILSAVPSHAPGLELQWVGAQQGQLLVPPGELRGPRAAERQLLLVACADRVAEALHRLELGAAARSAQVDAALERNRSVLLSSVSHDLKTPLASILAASTMLLGSAKLDGSESARELLETVVQEAERMSSMIVNLLNVTRLEGGSFALNLEPESLDELVFAALARLSGRFTGREVTVDVPDDLPLARLDAVLVDQLLVNLFENVLRYTPSGSPVQVVLRASERSLTLDVCDRGPGIDAGERERVFEKFYRGKSSRRNDGGTGLGLTICRAVARAHGGKIRILSRAGGGSVVRFTLPRAAASRNSLVTPSRRLEA